MDQTMVTEREVVRTILECDPPSQTPTARTPGHVCSTLPRKFPVQRVVFGSGFPWGSRTERPQLCFPARVSSLAHVAQAPIPLVLPSPLHPGLPHVFPNRMKPAALSKLSRARMTFLARRGVAREPFASSPRGAISGCHGKRESCWQSMILQQWWQLRPPRSGPAWPSVRCFAQRADPPDSCCSLLVSP